MKRIFVFTTLMLLAASIAHAQTIDQNRGADQSVDYKSLTRFGPWDDRNYQLTIRDMDLFSPDEHLLSDPIPAFFRAELRKRFPHLRRSGPAQYPRAAVPLFYKLYGTLIQDGRRVGGSKIADERESGADRAAVINGEIKLNQVLGANEVTIEINPANPDQVVAGSNNNGGQEMYYSTDGGENWTIQGTLPNTCCDPTVDWKSDGSIGYAAALSGSIGVSFWRSFNGGQTWVDRVDLTPGGSDKEFIHVDRSAASAYQDSIYLTYHDGNVMQFARSTDDGANFGITAFNSDPFGIGSDITTTPNGDIYYFYGATSTSTIVLLKSTDGGDTFASAATVSATNGQFDFPIPAMETRNAWIYTAADSDHSGGTYNGNIYVAWTDTTAPESGTASNNHTVIKVARSSNSGASWQINSPHPTADSNSVDRFNQWLKVDENGSIHVVYYDTQHSSNRSGVDLYYNNSTDGGQTWGTPQRISSATSANLTDLQEWGDYNGISVLGQKLLPVWTDNRDGSPNSRDVYVADATNELAAPTFELAGDNLDQQVCKPNDLADINVNVIQILGFTDPVTLNTASLPAGFANSFTVNPVNPPGSSVAQLSVDGSAAVGTHQFDILGSGGSESDSLAVSVEVFDTGPGGVTLQLPANATTTGSISPTLLWSTTGGAGSYLVEVDDDPGFGSPDFSASTSQTSIVATGLSDSTTHYWRVRAINPCGDGAYLDTFSFTTPAMICSAPGVLIPDGSGSVSDDLAGIVGKTIADLNVNLEITHGWVGDVSVTLEHVDSGTTVALMDRPGVPDSVFGCSNDDIDVEFDDSASNPVEDQCGSNPAIGGNLSPNGMLADFNDESSEGTWRLTVSDAFNQDQGTLVKWCLGFQFELPDGLFKHGFED